MNSKQIPFPPAPATLRTLIDRQEPLARMIGGLRVENGLTLRMENGRPVIGGGAAAAGRVAFGWGTVSGQTVTITGGIVMGSGAYVRLPDTVVSVGGNPEWPHLILATGDPLDTSTWQIEANSVEEDSFTGHSATRFRRPLFRVWLANGRPVQVLRLQSGVIDLQRWESP